MGTAILKSLLTYSPDVRVGKYAFSACVKTRASFERLKADMHLSESKVELGYEIEDCIKMIRKANIVILACRPEQVADLTARRRINEALNSSRENVPIIVSLLGGFTLMQLVKALDAHDMIGECCLMRVLPSPGITFGKSASFFSFLAKGLRDYSVDAPPQPVKDVIALFNGIGSMQELPDNMMNGITAVKSVCNGLSSATMDTLGDQAMAKGMGYDTVMQAVISSFTETMELMKTGMSSSDLKKFCATPNGIHLQAMLELNKRAVPGIGAGFLAALQHAESTPDARKPTGDYPHCDFEM